MINRVLIRIRVLQILYSSYQSENRDLKKAETDLLFSLQKSYDLYFYFLQLLVTLTDIYAKRVEQRKAKFLPTDEDVNPQMRLVENRFIEELRHNQQFVTFLSERPLSWSDNDSFVKKILDEILSSDIYAEYVADSESNYKLDRDFWRKVFKNFIVANENLSELLEDECLFWTDDVEIVESFVIKTIKKFDEGADNELLPMFKDDEDVTFATKLLRESMLNVKDYRDIASKFAKNWESERIAYVDLIILQMAVAELLNFPTIPISATLNEYINISKAYSTEKSASFINGILDSVVMELKASNKLMKK